MRRGAAAVRLAVVLSAGLVRAAVAVPPSAGGTITVEAAGGQDAAPAAPALSEALRDTLGERGFTILPGSGHSAYVAEVTLDRTTVGTGSAKVPAGQASVAPGLAGAAGGGVTMPLGGGRTRAVQLVRFALGLRIRARASGTVVWRGTAVTVRSRDPSRGDAGVISDLSRAVLRSYPHEAPGPVTIP